MKSLWISIFLLLAAFPAYAETAPSPGRSFVDHSISRPYFYQVTKGREVHYLLGTYHLIIQWRDFSDRVHAAFSAAKIVITKTQYEDKWRSYLKISFDDLVGGETENPKLSKKNQQKLHDLGIPEKLIATIADDDCSAVLFYPYIEKYPFYLLDADIYLQAKSAGKRTVRLDTKQILAAAETFSKSSSSSCSVRGMLNSLSTETILEIGRNGIDEYRSSDLDIKPSERDPGVAYRNQIWISKILETFQRGPSFVAVGATHLWGGEGLIALLAARNNME